VDWSSLSGNTNIPVIFFEKHIFSCEKQGIPDRVNWSSLSGNTNIPYQFFLPIGREDREKHISSCEQRGVPDRVNWSLLSRNTNIPLSFFEKHLDLQSKEMNIKVNWYELARNTNIPRHYNLIKLREIIYCII